MTTNADDEDNDDDDENDEIRTETTKMTKTQTMTTQTKMTTTTVAAGMATMDHGIFVTAGIRDAVRSQEVIYWHTPSGTQNRKDRYRDRRRFFLLALPPLLAFGFD